MYLIDGRGQRCLADLDPGLLDKLKAASVEAGAADIGIITPKGIKEMVTPMKNADRTSYWVPRHAFVGLLLDAARSRSGIRLLLGTQIDALEREPAGELAVRLASGASVPRTAGSLLVGADGMRSAVRAQLEEWDGGRGGFSPRQFDSPAAGLRYKVLTLPGAVSVETPQGRRDLESEMMYSVRGAAREGKLKLGMLPSKSAHAMRTANLITLADDPVWDAADAESFREYAERQWPHFPLASLVSEEELARFAADRGGRFPRPQYSPKAAWAPAGPPDDCGAAPAAVLVGDALHAFPPDLGQGVNSALQDVMALKEALDAEGDERPAGAAARFQEARVPEAAALVDMMRVAAPYQYSQSVWGSRLWTWSFLARLLLNKLSKAFLLPAFMQVQETDLTYSEAWRRGRTGARRARLAAATVLVACSAWATRLAL